MNLNQLPDLCLITILDRLPIRDLLRIGLVSHRFHQIQRTVCLQKTSLRVLNFTDCKYYGIYVEQDELDFYRIDNFDLLTKYASSETAQGNIRKSLGATPRYDTVLSEETAILVSRTFPNVEHFTIVDNYKVPTTANQLAVCNMISYWDQTLTHLTVIGQFNSRLLCKAVSDLCLLKHLSANMPLHRLGQLTIVPQLKEFNCRYIDDSRANDLSLALNELIMENDCIVRFGLDLASDSFQDWLPSVTGRLARLKVHVSSMSQLDWITTYCDSIAYLDLGFGTFYSGEIGGILTCLSRLHRLTELKLNILFDPFQLQPDNLFNEPNLPQLKSVQRVELRFPFDPHQLALVEGIFPSAKQVIFRISARQFVSFYSHLFCHSHCGNCQSLRSVIAQCGDSGAGGMDSVCFQIQGGRIQSHNIVVPK